jgi:hypothetical protein
VLARHDEDMAGIHRLIVHERDDVAVLEAHGDFTRAMNHVAERTRRLLSRWHEPSGVLKVAIAWQCTRNAMQPRESR